MNPYLKSGIEGVILSLIVFVLTQSLLVLCCALAGTVIGLILGWYLTKN